MATAAKVTEIWRYPVKSMGGESLQSADVGEHGIFGDRCRGLYCAESETVLTARRVPELLFASARVEGTGEVIITLPDGTETADDVKLSSWLQRPVTLIEPGAVGSSYENPMNAEAETDWFTWQGPAGSFHDSTKSMVSLAGVPSFADWDRRRFRTNLILDVGGEDELIDTSVAIGSDLVLDVTKPIDRCVMVSRPQPGLDADLSVLRQVNATGGTLSVGALISSPGTISVGDSVSVVG